MGEHPGLALKKSPGNVPPRIILTGARSAFIGPNLVFDGYRAAVATIIVGLDADIDLTKFEDQEDVNQTGPISVIAPGTLCHFETKGGIALLFCDVLSDDYSEIDLRGMDSKIGALRKLLQRGPEDRLPKDYLDQVFRMVGIGSERTSRSDIARVVAAIGREPENFATVESAASLIGLSPMRFQHVFTETVGMPFRRYRQWRRMGQVIRALADGASLTQAAYTAGFANSAHLSTAFKAMFGIRPSQLITSQAEYYLSDFVISED